VDPVNGDDANEGQFGTPLKTLARALCVTRPGHKIWLLPGEYSAAANGETFPLIVRGQKITASNSLPKPRIIGLGDVPAHGLQATMVIEPAASVQSELTALDLRAPSPQLGTGIAVLDSALAAVQLTLVRDYEFGVRALGSGSSTTLAAVDLSRNAVGIQVEDSAQIAVSLSNVYSGGIGIHFLDAADASVRSCSVRDNAAQNIIIASPNVDLGTAASPGNNTIRGAGGVNIWNRTAGVVPAEGNILDPYPGRSTDQSNADETDSHQNIANEFPDGCIKLGPGHCP